MEEKSCTVAVKDGNKNIQPSTIHVHYSGADQKYASFQAW